MLRDPSELSSSKLEVEDVPSDIVYACVATVTDLNGDTHMLRSNTLIVKRAGKLH